MLHTRGKAETEFLVLTGQTSLAKTASSRPSFCLETKVDVDLWPPWALACTNTHTHQHTPAGGRKQGRRVKV